MIVHVVAAEIGEGGGNEAHAVEPVLVEAVARCLQRGMGDALRARGASSIWCNCDRIGRGQAAIIGAGRRDDADRADRGGGESRRCLEDLADEGGDGGLAARAGDGDELIGLQRIEASGHARESADAGIRRCAGPERRSRFGAAPNPPSRGWRPRRDRTASARESHAVGRDALQRREQKAGAASRDYRRKDPLSLIPDASGEQRKQVGGYEVARDAWALQSPNRGWMDRMTGAPSALNTTQAWHRGGFPARGPRLDAEQGGGAADDVSGRRTPRSRRRAPACQASPAAGSSIDTRRT